MCGGLADGHTLFLRSLVSIQFLIKRQIPQGSRESHFLNTSNFSLSEFSS